MIYNCRICGNDADWDEGHGCALGTPENERHRLTLKERDVARAELLKLQDDLLQAANREVMAEALIERLRGELGECEAALQLGRDGIQAYCDSENAMRGELAEARAKLDSAERHIRRYHWDAVYSILTGNTPNEAAREQLAMGAPPPAESTPVLGFEKTDASGNVVACDGYGNVAPPDDIRERLDGLGRRISGLTADCDSDNRRIDDHERRLAALETKGEPGTHANDICARPKCLSPRHYNIHDPERGGHVFVEPKGAKP